ncbi:MAG: MoaD/ThiS family protein [Planctomycetales bacterium]|nr:MoaD/ThiS family protein [Planctomycetales bacterium]
MKIRLKLMGMLKDKTPADGTLQLPEGATIASALAALEIPSHAVQVCTVNGTLQRDVNQPLAAEDELGVVPPVGGG